MNVKTREIVGVDIDELIERLNRALADEWFAYYMYWVGARVVEGPMRSTAERELNEHAMEEFEHANKLADRIIKLGGEPLLSPSAWFEKADCAYKAPNDPYIRPVLEQNIEGEQCAIGVYNDLLRFIGDKDYVTHRIIVDILEEEIEHETELQMILRDIEVMDSRLIHTASAQRT